MKTIPAPPLPPFQPAPEAPADDDDDERSAGPSVETPPPAETDFIDWRDELL